MYTTHGYPLDRQLRERKAYERAEWRRRQVALLKRLLASRPAFARA